MQYSFFIIAIFSFTIACKSVQKCEESPHSNCICTEQYEPVCGCNGKTYGNACMAQCAGIEQFAKGECPGKNSSPKLSGTSWNLRTFAVGPNPQSVPTDVQITATFDQKRINGKGGCNNYGGAYTLSDKSGLHISGIISTKMFCDKAMKWETMYFEFLEKSRFYRIDGDTLEIDCGGMGTLVFTRK
jgi:heat shock protein HslJ